MKSLVKFLTVCFLMISLGVVGGGFTVRGDEKPKYSKRKIEKLLKKYPDADKDNDGTLSAEEIESYRAEMKNKKGNRGKAKKGNAEGGAEKEKGQKIKPTEANVKYGPHKRNVLDFYKAESDKPTPALINFHGGGFTKGNKGYPAVLEIFRKRGISVFSANYRLVKSKNLLVKHPMQDGARVVQFVRSKAEEWNIDPERIALMGSSAGACLSMWIATADDMADPESDDPVARQSTKVTCVWANSGQTSLDPGFMQKHIYKDIENYGGLRYLFGVNKIKDIYADPEIKAMVDKYSTLNQITKDDPPIAMDYKKAPPEGLYPDQGANMVDVIHSAKFGLMLKEKYDELGLESQVSYPGRPPKKGITAFILGHLGMK